MKLSTKILPVALLLAFLTSCSDDDNSSAIGGGEPPVSINTFVNSNANYSSLAAALKVTGLDTVLGDSNIEFTVFAPDNDALSLFLTNAGFTNGLSDIDTDEEIALVKNILLNHVIIGSELKANSVTSTAPGYIKNGADGPKDLAENVTKLSTYYAVVDGSVKINGIVTVTTPDAYDATNGIIHAIDAVIGLPKISTFATADTNLSTLAEALTSTELVATVDGLEPATVFAPNNIAFDKIEPLPTGDDLSNVLKYHVIASVNIVATDVTPLVGMETPATVQGQKLDIVTGPTIKGKANAEASGLVTTDIQAANGIIHIVDTVLLPAEEINMIKVEE